MSWNKDVERELNGLSYAEKVIREHVESLEKSVDSRDAEIKELEARVKELEAEVKELTEERDDLQGQLESTKRLRSAQ